MLIKAARVDVAGSALHAPTAGFEDQDFYPDLVDKAVALTCRLAWNHPLPDGNKRAAWAGPADVQPARGSTAWATSERRRGVVSHATGLPVVVGRPFCVYGPGENPDIALVEVARYLRWHLTGRAIEVVGDCDRKKRDFVHVSDLVSALVLIADGAPAGEVYNIGSGEETSMRELASMIGTVTARPVSLENLRDVTEDTYRLVADVSKLRELGFAPRISLAAGVTALACELGPAPELPRTATIFRAGQEAERTQAT
ncbi:hypothetical protein BH18ACT4_BH18ACT4_05640 [soil metagenome]